ncbi:MAG: hypothetical protein ACU84J_09820, partial [Gammaproteobacteria bacterium]
DNSTLSTMRRTVALMFLTSVGFLPNLTKAEINMTPVEGVGYSVTSSIADNLRALQGRRVSITLASGTSMTGSVKEVGDHLLHLEKLEGKEFFDALIRLDEISAVDTRFREIKR